MTKIELFHESMSLESMLRKIGGKNNIGEFHLPIYTQGKVTGLYPEHQQTFSRIKTINTEKLKEKKLSKILKFPWQVIAISSEVKTLQYKMLKTTSHLRQLDMDYSDDNVEEFIEDIKHVFSKMYEKEKSGEGFLVKSGEYGFHYYGTDVINSNYWSQWIETARSIEGYVDDNWCEQQLKRGFSVLRLTSSTLKPEKPTLLYRVRISKD